MVSRGQILFEILEPRVLLSASPLLDGLSQNQNPPLSLAEDSISNDTGSAFDSGFGSVNVEIASAEMSTERIGLAAGNEDLFTGIVLEDLSGLPPDSSLEHTLPSPSSDPGELAPTHPNSATVGQNGMDSGGTIAAAQSDGDLIGLAGASKQAFFANAATPLLVETLKAANGPPVLSAADLTIAPDAELHGAGEVQGNLVNHGVLKPGNSPGVISITSSFTQGPDGVTEIEIAGTGGAGAPAGHDQVSVAGNISLDGTVKIKLLSFIPSSGQSYVIFKWTGTRTGEIANWLGTAGIPTKPELAFDPVVDDVAKEIRLDVVSTPTIIPAADTAIRNGLNTLQQVGTALASLEEMVDDLPFLGNDLAGLVNAASGINQAIRNQVGTILDEIPIPRQSRVTAAIQDWHDDTVGGIFKIKIHSVLGEYGTAFWWHVKMEIEQTFLNQALENLTGALLGALFSSPPQVTIKGTLLFDFSFGYDSGFFVDINSLTARVTIDVTSSSDFLLQLFPSGGPASLNVTDWSVDLMAALVATPNSSVLTGGRITSTTLTNIANGTINPADAFDLDEEGTLDASLTLTGALTGLGVDLNIVSAFATIHSDDLFDGPDPDLTLTINGTLGVLGQQIAGIFTLKKTATETIIEAEDVSFELSAGAGPAKRRILAAENGTAKFVLLSGHLAGTASLDLTEGPQIPNLEIGDTSIVLTLNTSTGEVPTIDGETVNLPAGPYYRVEGNTTITLDVPATELSGDFLFEPFDPTPALANSGDEVVTVAGANISFGLGDGTTDFVEVTNGAGVLVFTNDGIVADATANVALTLAALSMTGSFGFKLNDRVASFNQTVRVNGNNVLINVPGGPYLRVAGTAVEVDMFGLELTGKFTFEQRETVGEGEKLVTVKVEDVTLPLGAATQNILNITDIDGLFLIKQDGIAGIADATVAVGIPSLSLTGSFGIEINNLNVAVNETVNLTGVNETINLPQGPYFKVKGTDITLTLFGMTLTADASFEKKTSNNGTEIVVVEATDVDFNFGTNVVSLSDGAAIFLFTDTGMAGQGRIDLHVNAFGGGFVQPVTWNFNNTGAPVDEIIPASGGGGSPFALAGETAASDAGSGGSGAAAKHSPAVGKHSIEDAFRQFNLPEGPYNRFSTNGPVGFSIDAGGRTQSFSAALVVTLQDGGSGPDYATIGISQLTAAVGVSGMNLQVGGGTGAFVLLTGGKVAGKVGVATASFTGPAGILLAAQNLRVEFNNAGADVGPYQVSISDDPAEDVTIQFGAPPPDMDTYFHNFFAICGAAELTVGGIALGGNFRFEVSGGTLYKVGVSGLNFDLKAGSLTVVSFHNGSGAFLIQSSGIAGSATLDFEVGLVSLSGTIKLEVNTTSAAQSATVDVPGPTDLTFNLPAGNYVRVYVDGHLHLGSIALPFEFLVDVDTGTNTVRIRNFDPPNDTLVTILSNGTIQTNIDFEDFAAPGPFELVQMLRQLGSWLDAFSDADFFDVEIPFTDGLTLGEAFDWSQGFLDEIFSHMVGTEIQSSSLKTISGPAQAKTLTNAKFRLKIGETTTLVTVNGNWTLDNDLTDLTNLFKTAFQNANIDELVEARIHADLRPVPNSNDREDVFVIGLKPEAVAQGLSLEMFLPHPTNATTNWPTPDNQIQNLGFGPGDGLDSTPDGVGVSTQLQETNEAFFVALANVLGIPFTYQEALQVYTFNVNESFSHDIHLPFHLGGDIGDIGSASLNGEVVLTPSLNFGFNMGFDLGAAEVPRILSASAIPVPANGRISTTARFWVQIDNEPSEIEVVIPAVNTLGNNSIQDLAADINTAFHGIAYRGTTLDQFLIAQKAGTGLAISVLNEDRDGDGVLGIASEDLDGDTIKDPGEDVDGDGILDLPENLNGAFGDVDLDNNLGLINRLIVRSKQDNSFATEMGFGVEPRDWDGNPATTDDKYYVSTSTSRAKGLFIENVHLSASLRVDTPVPISGSLRFGFVEVSTSGGLVKTSNYEGTAFNDITFTAIHLEDQTTGSDRFYINDLFSGLSSINFGNLFDAPSFTGSILAKLSNISITGLGPFALGANPEIKLWIPDITDLDFSSDPYNGTNTGIFLTFPDLGNLTNFNGLSFTAIIKALNSVADSLSQLSAFSFLDEKLPLIDVSINDLLDYASQFADIVEGVSNQPAATMQSMVAELKEQIDDLFNLDPSILTVVLDNNGVSSIAMTSGGVNGSTKASTTVNYNGSNNALRFESPTASTSYNGVTVRFVGDSAITDSSARASYNPNSKELLIKINGGVTTANAVISAVAAIPGHAWSGVLQPDGGPNNGTGTIATAALKFGFNFTTAYGNTFPLQFDLANLLDLIADDNTPVKEFLEAATSFIQVSGSGILTVSASAALKLDFGFDLTNPSNIRPFFYDTTGVELTAKILGTNINLEASLGSVLGIAVKNGTVTLDRDGDPTTTAGNGDNGARIRLGLREELTGDHRYYLDTNFFNLDNIDLSAEGGVSARLPVFAPTPNIPLGSENDEDGNGFPDNQLVLDVPDIHRMFITDKARGNTATIKFAGLNNDFLVVSSSHQNFEVIFNHDPAAGTNALPAVASFASNRLTVTLRSGVTTANQALTAIQGQATFNGSGRTADDDNSTSTSTNSGAGTLRKLTVSAPDFSSLFDNLDLCTIIDTSAGLMLDGLDAFLGSLEEGLNDIVSSTSLPLIGEGLGGAANFISDFRDGLLKDLRDAIDSAGSASAAIENALKNAFWDLLGPGGLNILVNFETGEALDPALGSAQLAVTLDCEEGLVVNLRLKAEVALLDTSENPIDLDIGVPGFGLEVDGNVQVAIGFDLKFGFGISPEDGFFFNSSAPASNPELRLYFEVRIPGLTATGELLFLQLQVGDDPDHPSFFTGQFVIDLKDPNGDGKLTFAEMTSSGVQLEDIIEFNLEAIADVNLKLIGSFGGNTAFPRVLADFHLDWSWDLQDGMQGPEISFDNIYLDLGTFISDFLEPILSEIRKITEPIQPLIDVVTARLPILSDLAGETITLLTLAEIFGLLEPSTIDFIEGVLQVIELINDLEGLGEGSILIPFGAFDLGESEDGSMTTANPVGSLGNVDLGSVFSGAAGAGASSTYVNQASGFMGDVGSMSNFKIPVFDNPSELFGLFTGTPVRLVEWRMPTFLFEFEYIQKIPIYPPLYAQFGGRVGAKIDIGLGFDTYGIQKFIESEDKNFIDILDGFYVIDFDANGNEQNEVTLFGELFAGVSINLGLVEVGVRGGLYVEIGFDLNDVNDDGRVRVSEIISLAQIDPRCIFNIHGEIGIFLEAFLKVDLFFFSIEEEWEFGRFTLIEFDLTCPEPVLAEQDGGGKLTLNVGTRAGEREEIDTNDGAETFIVTHVSGAAGSETVEVQWGNFSKEFTAVTSVAVEDAGEGDDLLDFRGVLSPVNVTGGSGNDTIWLGDGSGSKAWGGKGNDTITASIEPAATNVELFGDEGNDVLVGGIVSIIIHGGGGLDIITGTPQADQLYGDGGNDDIKGKDGDDIIEGGTENDRIEGNAGNDTIKGDAGNDKLYGHRGDDQIDGGAGSDEIFGSSGNDRLSGGSGNDFINGHAGIDLVIGDSFGSIVGTLADIPNNGIQVLGLTGSGNDFLIGGGGIDVMFGGDGDDYLYGGNFLNAGESDVIEEDQNDFIDGGAGDDVIFGDDSQGRTGDRNTGIAIKSSIFLDVDEDGIRDAEETGFGGVTIQLFRFTDDKLIGTEKTKSDGSFEFTGLDKDEFYLVYSLPAGLIFTPKYAGGAVNPEAAGDDSDPNPATGRTDKFQMDFDEIETSLSAGYQGTTIVSIADVTMKEGNVGQTLAIFDVILSSPEASKVEIEYVTQNISASKEKGDYLDTKGILVLNPGQLQGQIAVPVLADTTYESHEQFKLHITRAQVMKAIPENLSLSDTDIRGSVLNDDPVPALSIQDFLPIPGETTESSKARFLVTLSNPSQFNITVEYRTDTPYTFLGLAAQRPATPSGLPEPDFTNNPGGSLTFQAGETTKVISVQFLDDPWDEYDEHFFVDLFNPTMARIEDGRAYGIIPDDDDPVSVFIVPSAPKPGEPLTTVVTEDDVLSQYPEFQVKLSGKSLKDITVTYGTAPGTAVSSIPGSGGTLKDFEQTPSKKQPDHKLKLFFAPGDTTPKTFTVEVAPDNLVEGPVPEEFYVNLISATNAIVAENPLLQNNHVVVEIIDDDTAANVDYGPWSIRFSSDKYYVNEPEVGVAYAEIELVRTPGSSHAIAVVYTLDGTATGGVDYEETFRELVVFADREYIKKVKIPILADGTVEGIETVQLRLQNPTGGPVKAEPGEATLCILDGNTPKLLVTAPVYKDAGFFKIYGLIEGTGFGLTVAKFRVYLADGAVAGPDGVVVDYETIGMTARPIDDFTPISGNNVMVIAPGANEGFLNVVIKRDALSELTEKFVLRLSDVKGATMAPKNSVAICPIYDDDLKTITGRVFYDANGNGFMDVGEKGIKDVDVTLRWFEHGEEQTKLVKTSSSGAYAWDVALGSVSISVDPETVKSPNQSWIDLIFGTGNYETSTDNETQTTEFEGIVGISPFEPVGYTRTFSFEVPSESKDVGRGGTDDTIFGGPHDDTIDAGAGDDHVVGGHWMTATSQYVPVNTGNYDAKVTVTNDPANPQEPASLPPLHNIYDDGPIFGINTAGLNLIGKISGEIWRDGVLNNVQDLADPFLTEEVIVHLFDCAGNPINSVSTVNGKYEFTDIYVEAAPLEYIVQFEIPTAYEFVAPGVGGVNANSDAFDGGRTQKIPLSTGAPSASHIDAGVRPEGTEAAAGPGKIEFDEPSFSGTEGKGPIEISVARSDSTAGRSVVVVTAGGSAQAGVNFVASTQLLYFGPGETEEIAYIPVLDSGLGICDVKQFMVVLYDVTGRMLDRAPVYIFGKGAGALTDDDYILGNNDWDILIGDSGNIPAGVWPETASIAAIKYAGGPGKDKIFGGDGNDFVNGMLDNDLVSGDESQDIVWGGLGKDTLIADWGNDLIDGMSGRDTVISSRDIEKMILDGLTTSSTLIHRRGVDDLSTFTLKSVEIVKMLGGYQPNTFEIKKWNGSAHLIGANSNDVLLAELDMDLWVNDATLVEQLLYEAIHGYPKHGAISLGNGETYHLSSIESLALTGGPANNVFDASGYSKSVRFEGKGGNDKLIGGAAADTFVFFTDAALGFDTVTGNGGRDTIDFTGSFDDVIVDLSDLDPLGQIVNFNLDLAFTDLVENVSGGDGSDTLTGNSLSNVLIGGPGNDSLIGKEGSEIYIFDTDTLWGSESLTEHSADPGIDRIDFSGTTTQSIHLNLAQEGTPQVVNANLVLTINGAGFEIVHGGALNDVIRGNVGGNILYGNAGDDVLDGKSGDDRLDGGTGNDDLDGGPGFDQISVIDNTSFVLADDKLKRATGESDSLHSIERAALFGGSSSNSFDVSAWTGQAGINGASQGFDTLIAANDVALMTLTAGVLQRTGHGDVAFGGIERAVLTGGAGNNTINASAFPGLTTISGGPGADILTGGSGLDIIYGGTGADTITGGAGGDWLDGGADSDLIKEQRDALRFTLEDNRLILDLTSAAGDEEEDVLSGFEAAILTGGAGPNSFELSGWSAGQADVLGMAGVDSVRISLENFDDPNVASTTTLVDDFGVVFSGSTSLVGIDSIEIAMVIGSEKPDHIDASGFSGIAAVQGKGGNDTLISSIGSSVLDGGDGDDVFVIRPSGTADLDAIVGGAGVDTLDFRDFVAGVTVDLSKVALLQTVLLGEQTLWLYNEDIENVIGGAGADNLIGNSKNNVITGGPGVDTINGKGGTDTVAETRDASFTLTNVTLNINGEIDVLASIEAAQLTGGTSGNIIDAIGFSGKATLAGGGGNDKLRGGSGSSILIGGAGNDTLDGGTGFDTFEFDADDVLGSDDITDAGGFDIIDFSKTTGLSVAVDLNSTAIQVVNANLSLRLASNSIAEGVYGGAKNDVLFGNGLDNLMSGGLGNDKIDGRAGANWVYEIRVPAVGEPQDLKFVLTDTTLAINSELDQLANIKLAGLVAGAGNDEFDAKAFSGRAAIIGGAGNDKIVGTNQDDMLNGGDGDDELFGLDGKDLIAGSAGRDFLFGGRGNDDLMGGLDSDTYLFDKSEPQGNDRIFESNVEGAADTIRGAGTPGVDVNLQAANPIPIHTSANISIVVIGGVGTIEYSYP